MARHNGLQGKISAIRGTFHVVYDVMAGRGTAMGVPHKPEALERRIKLVRPL